LADNLKRADDVPFVLHICVLFFDGFLGVAAGYFNAAFC
jgi:hypothetical protein